ncbi:recombinase family protein [Mycobacterium asiaticum]|nr:recombinase family protein [Mycobacterium asiaticum]
MATAMYLRQSLDRSGEALAVSRQRADCLKLCDVKGWTDIREFPDNDRSASSGVRPAYQRMLAAIRAGEVDAVVVWDLDRLHRRPIELEEFIGLADEKRLKLATVTGECDLSTDNGRLFARIKGAVARSEVERKGARQKSAAKQHADMGRAWWSVRPFGYDAEPDPVTGGWWTSRRDPITKAIVHNPIREHPTEGPLLRNAYRAVLAGTNLETIAKAWNAAGVTGPKGGTWRGANLGPLLLRARNAGLREYRGEEVADGQWPAIVSREVYEGVRAILTDPARRTRSSFGRKHLLSGIAVCGECGHGLGSGTVKTGAVNYRCKQCFKVSRNAAQLDAMVVEAVVARLSRDDAADLVADRERPDIDGLIEQRKALREQQKALGVAHGDGKLSLVAFSAADQRLMEQIDALSAQIDDAPRAEIFDGVIGSDDVDAAFAALDLGRRRAIVNALMTVTVKPTGRGKSFDRTSVDIEFR